jgi:UDP-N-acetylglucosamine 2-epimerase (non-hydrolysing)
MPRPKKILHVVGARPNFMKIAPLIREMSAAGDAFEQRLVHTGQHYDAEMSDVFFEELGMPRPDINLEVGSGSHAQQTAQIMMRFEPVLLDYRPDWLVVPGDVNSTVGCSLVAAKLGIPVAHLEAGLRSFDRTMPEEINRLLTDQLADLLLTPSSDADENLLREGVPAAKIRLVGNIMIDTLRLLLVQAEARRERLVQSFGLSDRYLLATLHRPSNVDHPGTLCEILGALNELAPSIQVLFPVHPRTRQRITEMGFVPHPGLLLSGPLGYLDFLALEQRAALVITDSGGVQEETTYLGVPCLTARPNTERPVTISMGTNTLVASRRTEIVAAAHSKLRGPKTDRRCPPLWDGHTAGRIVALMRDLE